jgi:ABC-type glycerol-3-phosphate transport system substrate-binding protein
MIPKIKGLLVITLFVIVGSLAFASGGQGEKMEAETVAVDFWTHWCSNNEYFEPFWVDAAEQFNTVHPEVKFSINLNCVPYEGYQAKYSSAFDVEKGPGIFNGMTHVWAGQFGVADAMPQDIADKMDEVLIGSAAPFGMYEGVRYGLPLEGGNFMMMYINAGLYRDAGLNPDAAAKTYTEMLEHAKKLTKYDSSGAITQAGYAIRYKGHPFGIADKSAPFYHAWGAEWLSWDEKKASGYLNSSEAVGALTYYAGLVQDAKVSSVDIDNPAALFGQGLAGIMFRESWYEAWLLTNAPDLEFRIHPLPRQTMESGYTNNFPWAYNVSNQASETEKKWIWELFRWYVNTPEVRKEHYVKSAMLPAYSDIIDEPTFTDLEVFDAWKTMTQGRAAPTYYIPPAHEVLTIIGQATLDAMYGNGTPEAVLDKAARDIDAILAKY